MIISIQHGFLSRTELQINKVLQNSIFCENLKKFRGASMEEINIIGQY